MTSAESDHERWQRQERRSHPPDNEVAGAVPLDAVLGRTASMVVVLLAAHVFSTGIELDLIVRARRVGEAPSNSLHHHRRGPVRPDGVEDVMQLLVEYPDGRLALSRRGGWDEEDDDSPVLRLVEGSGSDRVQDNRYWSAPLSDTGDLTVVFAWPYRDMSETRTVISAAAIADARRRGVELWPYGNRHDLPEPH